MNQPLNVNQLISSVLVDKKTVTFDINPTPRPETGEKSSPDTGEGTTFVEDTVTVSSGVDPSVESSGRQSQQSSKTFISLNPSEQVQELQLY